MTQAPAPSAFVNAGLPIASPSHLGVVKPDGGTLKVTADGTLSVITAALGAGGGGGYYSPGVPVIIMPPPAIGQAPAQAGTNIDGVRPPGVKTIGRDHRFKVKRGIDLQGTNVINAVLVPTRPDELASKDYVDRVAAGAGGGGGGLGLTEASADLLYIRQDGGTMTGPLVVSAPASDLEPPQLAQLLSYFNRVPDIGGLAGLTNVPEGAICYVETLGQFYGFQDNRWIAVSPIDNPQGGAVPSPGTALPANPTLNQVETIGTTDFVWNGFAWDRKTPIDWSQVNQHQTDIDKFYENWFRAPKAEVKSPGVNDLNFFLEPGSYRIFETAVNKPVPEAGSLLVLRQGTDDTIGTDVGVQQVWFGWQQGTNPSVIQQHDIWTRVGYGQTWTPWKRLNEDWIKQLIESKVGIGIRFIGTYDGSNGGQINRVSPSVGPPYAVNAGVPGSGTPGMQDRDYLIVTAAMAAGTSTDTGLPTNNDDGTPFDLRAGDRLVYIDGRGWFKYSGAGGVQLPLPAADVSYVNTGTLLTSTTAQDAITELASLSGLSPIVDNGDPLTAATPKVIAEDGRMGAIFDVDIRAEAATGTWVGTVRVCRFGTGVDYTVFGEMSNGVAPVLAFAPSVVTNVVNLEVTSDIDLSSLRGSIITLRM